MRKDLVSALALTLALPLASLWPAAAAQAADIGVSVQISQPGVYGRVDIGRFPQPEVVVAQPVIIGRPMPRVEPVYMWVPPGHRAHWSRYCGQYHACGLPVYFVQDRWYGEHVHPRGGERRFQADERREMRPEMRPEMRRDERREDRREDRHDERWGEGRGENRGGGHHDRRD
jgi:hypothetical protein